MPSRLKRTTYRVTGQEKRRLLRTLVNDQKSADLLDTLIVSARVRHSAKSLMFRTRTVPRQTETSTIGESCATPETPTERTGTARQPIAEAPKPEAAGAFDPYGLPLVPTFQRGGANALADRLKAIMTVDHLRRMARAQQIALPADVRRGDVEAETVRAAIVKAVEKRIADRRAAAG